MEEYGKLADYYDFLMKDVDYNSWYKFIINEIKKSKISTDKVLEIGCGTGNITGYLKKDLNIKKVTAVDISEEMLVKLQDKIGYSNKVEVLAVDIVDMRVEKKYNVILACCDTINYILEENIETVFKKIYNSLEQDGIFHFDINSYYKLRHILGNNIFVNEEKNIFYTWENEFFEDTEECMFHLNFFVKNEKDSGYNRFTEEHIEKAYKEEDIVDLLEKIGFKDIKLYYDFKEKIDEKASRILIFAKKF